jgi:hypothetical protein
MTLILSGTNGLSDVDGDASTPAVRGTDANTGIFFPAADTIGLSVGGVEAARLVSGLLSVPANSTAASAVRLYEDTDNGTNYVDIIAPSAITSDRTLTLPDSSGTLLTGSISSTSTGSGTASSVASNTYVNIVSSLSLPTNSMIIAYYDISTSGGNVPSDATYGMFISTASNSAGVVAAQNGVGVYPKSGIANCQGTIMYFNRTGSTQSIWLAGQPYAGGGYNTPNYTVTYYIVSFA